MIRVAECISYADLAEDVPQTDAVFVLTATEGEEEWMRISEGAARVCVPELSEMTRKGRLINPVWTALFAMYAERRKGKAIVIRGDDIAKEICFWMLRGTSGLSPEDVSRIWQRVFQTVPEDALAAARRACPGTDGLFA